MNTKRSSLVLEVLVAFMLAAIALTIVAPSPHAILKRELKTARAMESERVATLTLNEIRPLISWEKMPPASSKTNIPLANFEVELGDDIKFSLPRSCKVGYLKGYSDAESRLISCEIKIDGHPFHYFFPQEIPKKNG